MDMTTTYLAPMKLSEAIRLGASVTPQIIGSYDDGVGTCAIGAAAKALGVDPEELVSNKQFFAADYAFFCHTGGRSIVSANDAGWTREEIADELWSLGH